MNKKLQDVLWLIGTLLPWVLLFFVLYKVLP